MINIKKITLNSSFINKGVRTSFGLDSKTGLDLGPTSPNNKFVKRRRKS